MSIMKKFIFVLCLVAFSAVAGYSQIVPEGYKGDINAAQVINCKFTSNVVALGVSVPTALGGSPVIKAYKNNDTSTESTAGITFTGSFDGIAGLNNVNVDTSADGTFYSAGSEFTLIITTGTLGGTSVAGSVLCGFSIADRYGSLSTGGSLLADLRKVNGGSTGASAGKLQLAQLKITATGSDKALDIAAAARALSVVSSGDSAAYVEGHFDAFEIYGDTDSPIYISPLGSGSSAIHITSGSSNDDGIIIESSGTGDAIRIDPSLGMGTGKAINLLGQIYVAPANTNDAAIKLVGNGTGKGLVGSTLAIPKGVAYTNFTYKLVLASDNKSPITGAAGRTCKISKDGGAFADCANSTSEIGLGWYKVTISATEMTADSIVVRFTATSANTTEFQLSTNP